MKLSVVIPVLDEEAAIAATISTVLRGLEAGDELFVVDGGSRDRTVGVAEEAGVEVVASPRGRGNQMNAGAARVSGDVLLFLHADTDLPTQYRQELEALLADRRVTWGRFDLLFDEAGPLLRLIAWLISARSRLFRSATGDQAIFVRRAEFEEIGGYLEPFLFEDVDLARRLRERGRMGVPRGCVVTSSRRWRNRGVWATTLRMWTLKSLYLAGVPSARLRGHYRDER